MCFHHSFSMRISGENVLKISLNHKTLHQWKELIITISAGQGEWGVLQGKCWAATNHAGGMGKSF